MKQSRRNHRNAWGYFVVTGGIPKDAKPFEWCLHHVDTTLKFTDPQRYDEWRIEDLVPMRMDDHVALHWADEKSKALRAKKIGDAHRGKPGHAQSEEARAKISAALMGHEVPEETRTKISSAQKGKKVPDEVIKKRLETYRRNHPPKPKQKKPDGRKGLRWINDGIRNSKIGAGNPIPEGWTFGRLGFVRTKNPPLGPMTDEHRRNISEARKGIKFSEEHRRRLSEAHRRNTAA